MDPESKLAVPKIDRYHYHSTLLVCFVLCVGISCAVLPVVPFGNSQKDSPGGGLSYATTRFGLTLMLFFFQMFVWCIVRKRDRFHENHEVFWPMRCHHCARAVGLLTEQNRDTSIYRKGRTLFGTYSKPQSVIQTKDKHLSLSGSLPRNGVDPVKKVFYHGKLRRSKSLNEVNVTTPKDCEASSEFETERDLLKCLLKVKTDHENATPCSSSSGTEIPFPLYRKPHNSLLKTFYIFGVIVAINVPIQLVANIICLITLENSLINIMSLLVQVLLDFTFVTLVLFAGLFFKNFYDAAFIDKGKFLFSHAMFFGSCFWIAVVKLIYPIGEIMDSKYGHVDYPCHLPGMFGIFIKNHETTLTPFYAESAIIAAAMMWQIWSSIIPQSSLKITNCISQHESLGPTYIEPTWGKICVLLKDIFRCRWFNIDPLGSNEEEGRSLLPRSQNRKCQWWLAIVVCIILGVTYFSLNQFLMHADLGLHEASSAKESTLTYLKWFLQTAFYLPLLAMYRYRIHLTNSARYFQPRNEVSLVTGLVGGHDRIILLSCLGVFTLNIFRFAGAVGSLVFSTEPRADVVLASYTLIFAFFQTYSAWVMTSFLLVVQRQQIRCSNGVKWTLICLIYTGILNATQWLNDNFETATWTELTMFYGTTQGMVIGVLLEPLTSLYGIHSAMIAYESYKTIRSDIHSRHMTVLQAFA